jgi:ABC-type multidrug transport system fused ATPase/permease subunit
MRDDGADFFNETHFDFVDLAELDRRSWLRELAIVSQQTQLWNGTIFENISYGSFMSDSSDDDEDEDDKGGEKGNAGAGAGAEKEEDKQRRRAEAIKRREQQKLASVVEAATAAQADEFIRALPDQYESVTGERGAQLSGGQAQRLSTALLRRPALLLLDEATAALDNESEAKVQAAIEALLDKNRRQRSMATLIIAHRLSTIKNADRILMLEKGALVEEGTHEELLRREGGLYAKYVAKGAVDKAPTAAAATGEAAGAADSAATGKRGGKRGGGGF